MKLDDIFKFVLVQVVVIAYLFVTSIVGLYSIPQFHRILPKTRFLTELHLNPIHYLPNLT